MCMPRIPRVSFLLPLTMKSLFPWHIIISEIEFQIPILVGAINVPIRCLFLNSQARWRWQEGPGSFTVVVSQVLHLLGELAMWRPEKRAPSASGWGWSSGPWPPQRRRSSGDLPVTSSTPTEQWVLFVTMPPSPCGPLVQSSSERAGPSRGEQRPLLPRGHAEDQNLGTVSPGLFSTGRGDLQGASHVPDLLADKLSGLPGLRKLC